jgi:uncharacterized protein (DUF1778 family)
MAKTIRLMETKQTVTFRLTKGVKRRLERAAAQRDLNLSEYVERAIEAQLAHDQIPTKPDFRAHFAKYPVIYDGGKALQSLFQDREESL